MAEEEEEIQENAFPTGRVKRIMRLDEDVKRVSAEALFLVSRSTELFLQFLAEKSGRVAIDKKRKTVNLEHIRTAVKRHQPTSDFLLDSLPLPPPAAPAAIDRSKPDKLAPRGTRRIDQIFRKPVAEAEPGAEAEVREAAEPGAGAGAEADVRAKARVEAQAGAQAEAEAPVTVDES